MKLYLVTGNVSKRITNIYLRLIKWVGIKCLGESHGDKGIEFNFYKEKTGSVVTKEVIRFYQYKENLFFLLVCQNVTE